MDVTPSLLSAFVPFHSLNPDQLNNLVENARLVRLSKGALVFKRGKILEGLYYLVKGDVDLVDSQFKRKSLSAPSSTYLEPLNGWDINPSVSAVAKSDVLVMVVGRDMLDQFLPIQTLANQVSGGSTKDLSANSALIDDVELETNEPISDPDWMMSLLHSPLFHHVPASHIQQLFSCFEVQEVEADEIIIRENERGDYFYVIESGGAIVLDKQQQILAALKPGQYFGGEALVGETTRNATVKMLTKGRLMRLNKDTFKWLLQEPSQKFVDASGVAQLGQNRQILDVRLPLERRHGWVSESTNIPLGNLRKFLPSLEPECVYVVSDDAGQRASVAVHLLTQAGFKTYILKNSQTLYGVKAAS